MTRTLILTPKVQIGLEGEDRVLWSAKGLHVPLF